MSSTAFNIKSETDTISPTFCPVPWEHQYFETDGSEFVLEDGTPYVGFYHIHAYKGPLVGKKHSVKFDQPKLLSFAEYSINASQHKSRGMHTFGRSPAK